MLDNLLHNAGFLILALVLALIFLMEGVMTVISFFRGQGPDINKSLNRDSKAMEELRKRVEELEKKDRG